MGYYSDVTLILRADAAAKLQKAIADGSEDATEAKAFIDGADYCRRAADGAVMYQWANVKWYSDFPEIGFIERFMQGMSAKGYYFIRIGEDYDDIEVSGAFDAEPFGVSLVRQVSVATVDGGGEEAVSAA